MTFPYIMNLGKKHLQRIFLQLKTLSKGFDNTGGECNSSPFFMLKESSPFGEPLNNRKIGTYCAVRQKDAIMMHF